MPADEDLGDETVSAPTDVAEEEDSPTLDDDDADEETEFDLGGTAELPTPPSKTRVRVNGGDGLTLSEANELVGDLPSTVVLIAGEANVGKTTLLVELFAQFLAGPVRGWRYAGSKTLSGFHRRHKPARVSSGSTSPATERTQDDNIRHLHLAVASEMRRVDLVVSDIRGEVFEAIVGGADARDELPFLPRVDVCVVLIDGELMQRASMRALQLLRAKQLLMGLLAPNALGDAAEVTIVATKADTLTPQLRDTVKSELEKMTSSIFHGTRSVSTSILSARPADQTSRLGLVEAFEMLTFDRGHRPRAEREAALPGARYFWNGSRP